MDNVLLMRVSERVSHLSSDQQGVSYGQLSLAAKSVAKRLALDERHGIPQLTGGFPEVMNGQDVGMLKAGCGLDLALESLRSEGSRQLGVEDFQSDRAVVPQVVRQVDRGHAAPPKLALETVPISQATLEPLAEVCHVRPVVWR
jgi:hypothetical protein